MTVLPFLDRSMRRTWQHRKLTVLSVGLLFALLYGTSIVSLMRSAQLSVSEDQLPLPETGNAQTMLRARTVLIQQQCINCHKIQGTGGLQGPDLSQAGWKFNSDHLRKQILNPQSQNPDTKMPAYEGKISEDDLKALVQYLSLMQ
jgi:cbb3-type cytochrome oxidase cytochrome c subunit